LSDDGITEASRTTSSVKAAANADIRLLGAAAIRRRIDRRTSAGR
jgi:hypothetical protein